MSTYQLLPLASEEFFNILDDTTAHRGQDAADELGSALTSAMRRLALTPGLGHLRENLASKPLYFYLVADEYYIIYFKGYDPLPITSVVHASRDIANLLRERR